MELRYYFTNSKDDSYTATFTSNGNSQYLFILNDYGVDKIGRFNTPENYLFDKDTIRVNNSDLIKNRYTHRDKLKRYRIEKLDISQSKTK